MMDARDLFGDGSPKTRGHGGTVETTEIIIGGKGGGHGERELMQMLGLDRGQAPSVPQTPTRASASSGQLLRDFLKATTPPSEAATMTR
jgi:hypothetical protein